MERRLGERDFFYGLVSEKEEFISLSIPRKTKRNQLIFLAEDAGDSAFYLESGEVRIFRIDPSLGKESIVFIRRPGDMFGLAEVIGGCKRGCNAQTITPCCLYEIKKGEFEALLSRRYLLAKRVIEVIGARLRYLGEQVENLMVCDVTTRLLKLLMYLCHQNLNDTRLLKDPIAIPVKLTQEQIAAMIGSCQQTVSETLRQLEREGFIKVSKREILLLKPLEALNRV